VTSDPQIEFVMMANHAESVHGLLYLSGGGWTEHSRPVMPGGAIPPSHLGIAVGVHVPWDSAGLPLSVTIDIETSDGRQKLATLNGQLNVSKPPGTAPGTDQHAVLAVSANVQFPHAGGYRTVARIGQDGEPKYWNFRVHDLLGMPMPGSTPSG
jgi:hypothetical protein